MVNEARSFALNAHGDQQYGTRPYAFHLDAVVDLLAPYGETAQVVGYLHDVVEDTAVGLDQIEAAFGTHIAACVALLTDAPGPNRKARKALTYSNLAQVSGPTELALIVKAADRLANVRACIADQKHSLWQVYRDEHPTFRQAAYRPNQCDALWTELDLLLAAWPADERS